jgi:hypothetical protein
MHYILYIATRNPEQSMMTTTEAKTLKYGDVVRYGAAQRAIVQRVTTNGVWVSYDGFGQKRGQYITERVAAQYLERVQ